MALFVAKLLFIITFSSFFAFLLDADFYHKIRRGLQRVRLCENLDEVDVVSDRAFCQASDVSGQHHLESGNDLFEWTSAINLGVCFKEVILLAKPLLDLSN